MAAKLAETPNHLLESGPEVGYATELANLLHHQPESRVLDFVGTETVRSLFTGAWSILHMGPYHSQLDLETEKLRVELLGVCDAAGSALVRKSAINTIQILFTTREEVLSLIVKTPLPTFDQNIHEK